MARQNRPDRHQQLLGYSKHYQQQQQQHSDLSSFDEEEEDEDTASLPVSDASSVIAVRKQT